MKKFTTAEIRDLLNQLSRGEISFSQMVEIMNERVSERVSEWIRHELEHCNKQQNKTKAKVTVAEIRDLLNQVYRGEISISRMEEMVNEAEDTPAELKKGDLAIFWEEKKKYATIRIYDQSTINESEGYLRHKDNIGSNWKNAIKFESKEQYEQLIKGEI